MSYTTFRLVACATALHLVGATAVAAQSVSVAAIASTTSHDLLNRPVGVMASFGLPLTTRVSAVFGVARLRGTSDGTKVVCGGLIDPSRCPVEPFRETGRLSMVTLGADVRLAGTRMAEVSFQPQFLWGRARAETLGGVTGNRLYSDRAQFGFSGGLEVRSFPVRRFPVGVVAGGTIARLGPANVESLADGYTPFDQWYSYRTVYLGAVFQSYRRRR